MSTTVIASRLGVGLYLAPWRPGEVDVRAVRAVAAAHGVDLFDADQLNTELEAIVAAGLEPAQAGRLAAALREEGLTVRVVNDPRITQSARVSNALGVVILVGAILSPLVVPMILALVNFVFLTTRGMGLPVIGAPSAVPADAARALERLRSLDEELPAHVLDPLIAQAEALARQASADPGGPAIRALQEVLEDLNADGEIVAAKDGRTLRAELARARRAAREVG